MYEIERKFLIKGPVAAAKASGKMLSVHEITQSYLGSSGKWTVRVRRLICGDGLTTWTLTLKKKVSAKKCIEIESAIDMTLYNSMAKQCTSELSKTRTTVLIGEDKWEIDEFHHPELGDLVLAEIELEHEDQKFSLPGWIGKEVTSDPTYKNAGMAKRLSKRGDAAPRRRK